jgi:hypothetical protein
MKTEIFQTHLKWSKTNRFVRWLPKLGWLHEGRHILAAHTAGVKVVRATPRAIEGVVASLSTSLLHIK